MERIERVLRLLCLCLLVAPSLVSSSWSASCAREGEREKREVRREGEKEKRFLLREAVHAEEGAQEEEEAEDEEEEEEGGRGGRED